MPGSETSNRLVFYYVYVLESEIYQELYIGYTKDLRIRIKKHNQGLDKSTKPYRPWKLIYYEACLTEKDAKRREKYFKKTQGRRLLRRRLKEYFYTRSKK